MNRWNDRNWNILHLYSHFKLCPLIHTFLECHIPVTANRRSVGKCWRKELSVNDIHPTSSRVILQRDLAHFRKQLPPRKPPTLMRAEDLIQSVVKNMNHIYYWSFTEYDNGWKMKIWEDKSCWWYFMIDFSPTFQILQTVRASQWCSFPPDGWWRQALILLQHTASICHRSSI